MVTSEQSIDSNKIYGGFGDQEIPKSDVIMGT